MISVWEKGSIRAPESLWKDLHRWAAQEQRGVKNQVQALLRQALARRKSWVRR